MEKDKLEYRLAGLEKLRDEGPEQPLNGICNNTLKMLPQDQMVGTNWMKPYFRRWPKFSGVGSYPIPAPDGSKHAYFSATSNEMWSRTSPYGKLRWELLDFLIEELENERTAS